MNIYETYFNVIIPVTCRVDGYTRKRKCKEESAFLIRLNSQWPFPSICPPVRRERRDLRKYKC